MKGVFNMMCTGIVRCVDDLGRVVIPKEIRRNMGIKEGEPLEIYTDPATNSVVFRKYVEVSFAEAFSNLIEKYKDDEQAKSLIEIAKSLTKINEG
jgi:AbrB family looped-hinge helix DNA binding protein